MRTMLINGLVTALLTVGAVFLFATPARSQHGQFYCWEECYLEWHEVCEVTPDGTVCEGHWDLLCYLWCFEIP